MGKRSKRPARSGSGKTRAGSVGLTKEERDAAFADLAANPEEFKRRTAEEIRREYPDMTEEQIEWSWRQVKHQFGL